MDRTTLWIILGIGLVGGGLAFWSSRESPPDDPVRRARDSLFEVGPNCDAIRWRWGALAESDREPAVLLATARAYYIEPAVRAIVAEGVTSPREITAILLTELFPECDWPPAAAWSSHNLVFLSFGAYVTQLLAELGVPVADPVPPPTIG